MKTAIYIQFSAEPDQKDAVYQKMLQIVVVKVSERICLSPTGGELGGSKDCRL